MLQAKHSHPELYQQAVQLAKEVYRITEAFPDGERAVLVYTLRRLTVLLCQDVAISAVKIGKKQRRCLEVCLEHCIAIDAQLELALTVMLVTEESAREATTLLHIIYENLTRRMPQS